MANKLQNSSNFLQNGVSIMKAIYKPKPARGFEGALQQIDLQKAVYHSKLSANSTTTVICDTTERTCIPHTKTRQFLTDVNATLYY